MRRITAKIYESAESIETVKKIVKKAVQKQSKDLKVLDIIVALKEDEYGDDYYDVKIIFDGGAARPKKGLKIDLRRVVRQEMEKNSLELSTLFWVIPDSEYKALKTEAA